MSKNPDGHQSRCPRCGLPLQVIARGDGRELSYDFVAWNRLCKDPLLGGPSICLARACEPVSAPIDLGAEYRDDRVVKPVG